MEQGTHNPLVVGSNPAGPTTFPYMKGVPMRGFLKEFKEFVSRGNVMDMAVGIIIGAAFTAIVTSLVSDVVMPIVSLAIGGADFSSLAVTFGTGDNAATLNYGNLSRQSSTLFLLHLLCFALSKQLPKHKIAPHLLTGNLKRNQLCVSARSARKRLLLQLRAARIAQVNFLIRQRKSTCMV